VKNNSLANHQCKKSTDVLIGKSGYKTYQGEKRMEIPNRIMQISRGENSAEERNNLIKYS